MSDKTFYVTTPIYYVNARPHIGHAYTTIVADVLARRHRLLGEDTFFLTGTDEHGQKIERSAAAAGIPPQQFADQVSKSFEDLWRRMGILRDTGDPLYQQDYIRTTDPRHKQGVQKLFAELYKNGFIYLASYTGAYCVSDEAFVDAPVGTPCPDCGRILEEVTEENFFFKLSAFQLPLIELIVSNQLLIEPTSARNEVLRFLQGPFGEILVDFASKHLDPERRKTEMDYIQEAIEAGLLGRVDDPRSQGGSIYLYVPGALKDLSISRSSFSWGVPVPEPAATAAAQKHVIYVWLDALANYMTAVGYGSSDDSLWQKFWPADVHLVGKEITRFHCVYWPAFLLAADLPLPKAITAHGWLLFEDSKMSKSKGNIVRTETILDAFGTLCPPPLSAGTDRKGTALAGPQDAHVLKGTGFSPSVTTPAKDAALAPEGNQAQPTPSPESTIRRGTASAVPESTSTEDGASAPEVRLATKADRDLFASDVLRYFLLREIPFGQDGSFSFDALITRYNADLANGYGNLVSRTLSMIQKYSNSNVPTNIKWEPEGLPVHAYSYLFGPISGPGKMAFDNEIDKQNYRLRFSAGSLEQSLKRSFENNDFNQVSENLWWSISGTDSYLSSNAPWKMEEGADRDDVLYTAAESIRIITALLYPILPYATAKVWQQLGLGDIELAARNGELNNLKWGDLKPGTKLGPLGPIFPRADKGLAQIMTDMENPTPVDTDPTDPAAVKHTPTSDPAAGPRTTTLPEPSNTLPVGGSTALTTGPADTPSHAQTQPSGIFANQPPVPQPTESGEPTTPQITIDDFAKIELRVAQILVAERIPKADKLLRLEVDLGPHGKRQILSGIAEWYTPEDLIGRRIVVITNLAPRKMRGLESHGMLLAASHGENGKPVLATFGEDIALGSRLK